MRCPRCNGPIIRNQDQHESYMSCLLCGYEPRITPLADWYLRQETQPTEDYYPQRAGSKTPPTRRYE